MATERFTIKAGARNTQYGVAALALIGGLAFIFFITPIARDDASGGDDMATLMTILGFILIAGAAYFAYSAYQGAFVELSDSGVNVNGKDIMNWGDIEGAEEEEIEIENKGIKLSSKYKLHIRYADQQTRQMKKTAISSDIDGYDYIKERVLRKAAEGQSAGEN